MELFEKIVNGFGEHCAGVFSLIKLLAALKKETEIFKNIFVRKTSVQQFWIEYKYNNTKINMKHNYIHFIKFVYRASPVAASGHLQYFLFYILHFPI